MGFQVNVFGPQIGAEITGWDARNANQPDIDELKLLLASHGVLALRDQELPPAEFKAFAGSLCHLQRC
jgi:alpha-ketoglutarate-dependent taurine dioxygenase